MNKENRVKQMRSMLLPVGVAVVAGTLAFTSLSWANGNFDAAESAADKAANDAQVGGFKLNGMLDPASKTNNPDLERPTPSASGFELSAQTGSDVETSYRRGIFEEQVPFSKRLRPTNQFHGPFKDKHYHVYAGARYENSSQGVLVVQVVERNRTTGAWEENSDEWINTPGQYGAVSISREENGKLLLKSTQGKNLTFDLSSLKYLTGGAAPTPKTSPGGTFNFGIQSGQ